MELPAAIENKMIRDIKKCLYCFVLARTSQIQEIFTSDGGEYRFDGNKYDSFENYISGAYDDKKLKVITVTREAVLICLTFFRQMLASAKEVQCTRPESVLVDLVGANTSHTIFVRYMMGVVEEMRPCLADGNMSRYMLYPETFAQTINNKSLGLFNLVFSKDKVARLFVDFLKCISWFAGGRNWEQRTTLNEKTLRSILRDTGAIKTVDLPETIMDEIIQKTDKPAKKSSDVKGSKKSADDLGSVRPPTDKKHAEHSTLCGETDDHLLSAPEAAACVQTVLEDSDDDGGIFDSDTE